MNPSQNMTIRIDTYTRVCLTLIAFLLTVIAIGLWAETPNVSGQASAQQGKIYGPTKQRADMINQQKAANSKLDELISLFREGKAKVQVSEAEADQAEKLGGKDEKSSKDRE